MTETKTKTCVECDAVVSQWWEEDGDSYCNCCWSAMGRSCDGCWDDDCELCNGDDTDTDTETKTKTDYYYESLLEVWKDDGRCSNEEALSCLTDPDLTVEGGRRMFDDYVDRHPEGPLTDAEVWEVHRRLVEYYKAQVDEEDARANIPVYLCRMCGSDKAPWNGDRVCSKCHP